MATIVGKWKGNMPQTGSELTFEFLENGYLVQILEGTTVSKSGPDESMLQELKYSVDYNKNPHWIDHLSQNPIDKSTIVSQGIFEFPSENELIFEINYAGTRPTRFTKQSMRLERVV